jgi:arabinoxylan arabinofuranohydrolase
LKQQVYNPYLPPWEFIPDGEPRVFGDRLYVFGSHDKLGGKWYCENDYVAWSCPVSDLSDWRYEGVIFEKGKAPRNGNLYAPDVIQGLDGRFYLYFSKDDSSVIGVAVCDTPAGRYEYIGEVSYRDGKSLGDDENEYFMFDPSVLIDGGRIWLYSGSSPRSTTTKLKRNMAGCTVTELEPDMVTVKTPPKVILPGTKSWNTDAYFEAPSARKINGMYYIVYSVRNGSGLHYATSKYPDRDFTHQGSIHSTSDFGLNGHGFWNLAYPMGNSHGGLVELNGQWYIFDHRMTNNSAFSRQGVAEPIVIAPNGTIKQVESTSCGLNGGPLQDCGTYPAYIACNLMSRKWFGKFRHPQKSPYIKCDGADGDETAESYISGIKNGYTAGFKYFACSGGNYELTVTIRGNNGKLSLSTQEDERSVVGNLTFPQSERWQSCRFSCTIPEGKQALFFTYHGSGSIEMMNFTIKRMEE